MVETLGLTTAHELWNSLQKAYHQDYKEIMKTLRDTLIQIQKVSSTISEFGAKLKVLCDQLSAIGHPMNEIDICHWFLYGRGASFETFPTTYLAIKPTPTFHDLISQAESQKLFLTSIHGPSTLVVAFTANRQSSSGSHSHGNTYVGPSYGRVYGSQNGD